MKYLSSIFLLLIFACHRDKPSHLLLNKKANILDTLISPINEKVHLYKIIENDLIGYIDSNGQVKITPQFHAAQDFSEGLAAARLDGSYGYINQTGQYIIPPRYDLAKPFNHGLAKVFIDGKAYFIDKQARIQFQHDFIEIEDFGEHTYARVFTMSGTTGVIDRKGNLIMDTTYGYIDNFMDGVAVITEKEIAPNLNYRQQGLIDSAGKWIVRFGTYKFIGPFTGGYAIVGLQQKNNSSESGRQGVINNKGQYRFSMPDSHSALFHSEPVFSEGLAVVQKEHPHFGINLVNSEQFQYWCVIDTWGKVVFCNDVWKEIKPFQYGRSFAEDVDGKWHLINTKGQIVSALTFDEVLHNTQKPRYREIFSDGVAIVRFQQGWAMIDTSGKLLTWSNKLDLKGRDEKDQYARKDSIIYWIKYGSKETHAGYFLLKENRVIDMKVDCKYSEYLESGLIRIHAYRIPYLRYISKTEQSIWSQKSDAGVVKELDIDYMNRGYFYASSKTYSDYKGDYEWATSGNKSVTIKEKLKGQSRALQVIIDDTKEAYWRKQYKGRKVFIVNQSNKDVTFKASDSRLYMIMQALDKNGLWRDIEYSPQSWCGNSYHTVVLPENSMWEFNSPIYHGAQKTKLRAKLRYLSGSDRKKENILYSNEIDGYINPGQFWNQMEYEAQGIMDPYYN